MSENQKTYTTKKSWEYSTDAQETILANDLLTKACIDGKKTLTPDDKKAWIAKILNCAKGHGLTLSSNYGMFGISFYDSTVSTIPSQVARMLIGAAGIKYSVIFVHVNDKFSYHGINKMSYEKIEYSSGYAFIYDEFKNESGKQEISKITGIKNLLCVQVELDLGKGKEYPPPIEVEDICLRANMSKIKTVKNSVWLKHLKAMVEKTVALKLAKDYKYYLDTVTGYDKPIGDFDIDENPISSDPVSQTITDDDFDPATQIELTRNEVEAIASPTVVKLNDTSEYTMIEKDNLTAEQILAQLDRWSSEVPAIKAKAIKMIESEVIVRAADGKLAINKSFNEGSDDLARKIILQVWHSPDTV